MLRIWLFGAVQIEVDGTPAVTPSSNPAQRLLAYLALHPGELIPTERVSRVIWDTSVDDNFRKAKSQLIADLIRANPKSGRSQLAQQDGRTGRAEIGLVGEVWVDVLEFERRRESDPEQALELVARPFLADIAKPGPRLTDRRLQLVEEVADTQARLSERAWANGDHDRAHALAEQAVESAPTYVPAVELRMRLLASAGRRESASELGRSTARKLDRKDREALLASVERIESGAIETERPAALTRSPTVGPPSTDRDSGANRVSDRRRWIAGVVTVLVAGSATAFALSGGDGGADNAGEIAAATCDARVLTEAAPADIRATSSPPPTSSAPRSDAEIVTRSRPRAIAGAVDGVWLTQSTDGSVWRIDPEVDSPVGQPWPVNGTPFSLAVAEDAVWVTRDDGVLVQLDRAQGEIIREVKFGPSAGEVAVGAGSVWVNIYDGKRQGQVARIDPCSGAVEYLPVGDSANTVLYAYDAIWTTDSAARELHRLDPATGTVQDVALDVSDPQDIGAGRGEIWIAHYGPKRATRVDARSLERVGEPIEIGPGAAGVVVGAGAVWIPNYEGDSVTRIDLRTLRGDPNAVAVGDSPTDIALSHGRLWIPNNDAEPPTVTSIRP